MVEYSIKDLEFLSGIKAHTLRIWETRYGFITPERSLFNFRKYSVEDLKTVLIIAYLQRNGFKLAKLKDMSPQERENKTKVITSDNQKSEKRVLDMLIAYLNLDIPLFELYVQEYIQRNGIDKAINHLVIPFIERSRIMYNVDRDLIFDNVVRSVLKNFFLSAVVAQVNIVSLKKNIILFTPEENNDEISINYAYYSFQSIGISVNKMTKITNFEFLQYLSEQNPISAFVTVLSHQKKFNLEKYLYYFHQNIPDYPLIVVGTSTENYAGRVPKNVIIKKYISEAVKYFL